MTLCPINTLKQQLTNPDQIYNRCSLHCHWWTVKGSDCASAERSSKTKLTGRTSERNGCYGWRIEWSLENLSNGWSSIVCDELQVSLSVAICSSCFSSFVCWCYFCCIFRNYFFVPFVWWLRVRSKTSSTATMLGNTPIAVEPATFLVDCRISY